jgi:hypothetical protein
MFKSFYKILVVLSLFGLIISLGDQLIRSKVKDTNMSFVLEEDAESQKNEKEKELDKKDKHCYGIKVHLHPDVIKVIYCISNNVKDQCLSLGLILPPPELV